MRILIENTFFKRQALFVVSVLTTKPVFVVSVFTAKPLFIVSVFTLKPVFVKSVGHRVFKKIKSLPIIFVNLKNEII